MLEQFRKHASSLFTKIIFGVIALIFALYFGFSGGGPPAGGTAPIAKVNGENIPSGLFSSDVQAQVSFYQQLGQDTGNPDFQKLIETQVLQRLIQNELLSQAARSIGMHITDEELAAAIRGNPNFQRGGRFDENFYLKQFKPFYQRQNGIDYEVVLREELLQERFRELLDQAGVVSRQQVKDALLLRDTEMSLKTLEVPFRNGEGGLSKEAAQQLAQEWIALKREGKDTQTWLKSHPVTEREDGIKSLQVLVSFFGGEEALPLLTCLLQLAPGQVCQEAFQIKDRIVTAALLERKVAQDGEAQMEEMQAQLAQAKRNQIYSGVYDLLTQEAKIETFLQP